MRTDADVASPGAGWLATMSHEIRTPLNAVLGTISLLGDTELDAEQEAYVEAARSGGRVLLALVEDILEFSAMNAGTLPGTSEEFAPRSLVADVAAEFGAGAERHGVVLRTEVAAAVPDLVVGDHRLIRRALANLVGNAVKFTAAGVVDVVVELTRGPGSAVLGLTVRDTGIGIPADRRQEVFLPFTQLDQTTTRAYGGAGLGLAVCRLIADRLGAELSLQSTVGVGSTFTLRVPVTMPQPSSNQPSSNQPASTGPGHAVGRELAVLVAEDDPVSRMVAVRMLAGLGVEAEVALDGVEVLEAFERRSYDIVFMDIDMPRLDGVGATKLIRARARPDAAATRPWIVAVTANALAGDRERFLAAGMNDYVSKPVTVESFAGALRTYAG